jgi:hypothetical protein
MHAMTGAEGGERWIFGALALVVATIAMMVG